MFVELTVRLNELVGQIWGPLGQEAMELMETYSDEELRLITGYLRRGCELLKRHRQRVLRLADEVARPGTRQETSSA